VGLDVTKECAVPTRDSDVDIDTIRKTFDRTLSELLRCSVRVEHVLDRLMYLDPAAQKAGSRSIGSTQLALIRLCSGSPEAASQAKAPISGLALTWFGLAFI
jgi:hypothetical protein